MIMAMATMMTAIVLMAPVSSAQAQQVGRIDGIVFNEDTTHPLPGAIATLDDASKGPMTAVDGTFHLPNVSAGVHTVRIRSLGFVQVTKTVTVVEGRATTLAVVLKPRVNTLDQVVVTGTIIPTERKAVPMAMTVITGEQLQQRGITHIDQLFHGDVPGVFAQTYDIGSGSGPTVYGGVQMFSRGVSSLPPTAGYSPIAIPGSIKTYVDGIELTDPSYLNTIDPRSIERIEILSGPQASTIYGSAAINGVMQVFTKKTHATGLQWLATASAGIIQNPQSSTRAPSHDDHLELRGRAPGASYTLGGGYQSDGEWSPGFFTREKSAYGGAAFDVVADRLSIQPSLRFATRQLGLAGYLAEQTRAAVAAGVYVFDPLLLMDPAQTDPTLTTRTVGVTINGTPWSFWQHQATFGRDGVMTKQRQRQPRYSSPTDTMYVVARSDSRKFTGQYNNSLNGRLMKGVSGTLTTGTDYTATTAGSYSGRFTTPTEPLSVGTLGYVTRDSTRVWNRGYFGQGQIALWDAVFLTAGLRIEKSPNYGVDYGYNYAPRFGASFVHDVGDMTAKVRASYGKATRPPTTGQRDSITTVNPYVGGTYLSQFVAPHLGPEYQSGSEFGVELYTGTGASLSITHYDQRVKNLIYATPVDSLQVVIPFCCEFWIPQIQNQNAASIKNTGWEGEGRVSMGPVSVQGTWSYTRSRVQSLSPSYVCTQTTLQCLYPGRSLAGLAEHTGAVVVTYSDAISSVSVHTALVGQNQQAQSIALLNDSYYGRLRVQNSLHYDQAWPALPVSGYGTFDLHAARTVTPHMQIFTNVTNLGNSSRSTNEFDATVPGRTTMIGITLQ